MIFFNKNILSEKEKIQKKIKWYKFRISIFSIPFCLFTSYYLDRQFFYLVDNDFCFKHFVSYFFLIPMACLDFIYIRQMIRLDYLQLLKKTPYCDKLFSKEAIDFLTNNPHDFSGSVEQTYHQTASHIKKLWLITQEKRTLTAAIDLEKKEKHSSKIL